MKVTPSQTVGPYFKIGLIDDRWQNLRGPAGDRITVTGTVFDADGQPVTDAMLEVWQPDHRSFGRFAVDPATGSYTLDALRPVRLSAEQAPHICVGIFARGLLKRLYTRIYVDAAATASDDPILALVPPERRATLLAEPLGPDRFRFDVRLSGAGETVFFEC